MDAYAGPVPHSLFGGCGNNGNLLELEVREVYRVSLTLSREELRRVSDPKSSVHRKLIDAVQEVASRTVGSVEITVRDVASNGLEDQKRYLTTKEVADTYRVPERTVRYWCQAGRIEAVRIGGRQWRIPADQFDSHAKSVERLRETVDDINKRFDEPVADEYE